MQDAWNPPSSGPIDDRSWPDCLVAKAVDPRSTDARMYGYAILGDLAPHYSFADTLFVSLTGELPHDRAQAKLFEQALIAWSPISIAEAPTHVAALSRLCGARLSAALGAGLAVLGEHAHDVVNRHRQLVAWLAAPTGAMPAVATAPSAPEYVQHLQHAIGATPSLSSELSIDAARIVLLFAAGLRTEDQLVAAIMAAGTCGIFAEALSYGPPDLPSYPITLPPFQYVETP
jgi:hypothetical protein